MSNDEQARYDREFLIIAICHTWTEKIAPILRVWKPYLGALNQPEAK